MACWSTFNLHTAYCVVDVPSHTVQFSQLNSHRTATCWQSRCVMLWVWSNEVFVGLHMLWRVSQHGHPRTSMNTWTLYSLPVKRPSHPKGSPWFSDSWDTSLSQTWQHRTWERSCLPRSFYEPVKCKIFKIQVQPSANFFQELAKYKCIEIPLSLHS